MRLSLGLGRRDGIRPADIVGSIANEANVPGRDIGPIDIQEEVTYVGIPERYVEVVLAKVGRKRFRGRALNIRVASNREEEQRPRPRPRTAERPERPERPRRDGDRPERPRMPTSPFDRFGPKKKKRF